jgi:formylglycine-generating enzyme required for sulfatase activity
MKKSTFRDLLVLLFLFCLTLSGCGFNGMQGGVPPGGDVEVAFHSPQADFSSSSEAAAAKAGGQSFNLKCGWNIITFSFPQSRKFSSATMTYNGQTKLLKNAVASGWTQNAIRYLRGRCFQQIAANSLTASFQPGGTYYVYSRYNRVTLEFDRPCISGISPTTGNIGEMVTITGVNLGASQGTSTVTFGGVSAGTIQPDMWSDTQIICPSPSSGTVVVTVNGKRSNDDKMFLVMEFVAVPAGEFTMGSPSGEGSDREHPQHTVFLDAYDIGKYEVTNALYSAFEDASGYHAQGNWRNYYNSNTANHPAISITWNDAKAFCDYYGYRLPTEAEWEKAARGTDGRNYPWGNVWDQNLCNNWNGPILPGYAYVDWGRGTLPVGSFPGGVSPYGCLDMAGNIMEWCNDWFSSTYYSISPSSNPQGPLSGTDRVCRGGNWGCAGPSLLRCVDRDYDYMDHKSYMIGFRVVRDVPSVSALSPSSGNTGTVVTVSGKGFGPSKDSSTITFNGVSAAVITWSSTQIVCTAPANGAVIVTVNGIASNDDKLFSEFMVFVAIPAGEFPMGSAGGYSNEQPQHTVYLDAYDIGKYEVTNAQFSAFVAASGYLAQGDWQNDDGHLVGYSTDYPDNPVVCVSWNDAKAFCDYYGYRLPTEAEWEKAARGTDGRNYPWGSTWDKDKCNSWTGPVLVGMANLYEGRGTLPVGLFDGNHFPALNGASQYGVMDMAGNVREWCNDFYDGTYYVSSPYSNPQGPATGSDRVLRGGSWSDNDIGDLRCIGRCGENPNGGYGNRGFRVARTH